MSDRARISPGASEVSAVGSDQWGSEGCPWWGSHGLHSPLGTAAQFLHESPSFLWAPGIPEPCTFKQGPEEAEGRGGESASVLTQLGDRRVVTARVGWDSAGTPAGLGCWLCVSLRSPLTTLITVML